jgi:hypothetical protein
MQLQGSYPLRRAGIHTGQKIYFGFCSGRTWSPDRRPLERANMPAQDQELKKNYISILSDKPEEQRAVDSLARTDRHAKDYLLDLVAAVLSRKAAAR